MKWASGCHASYLGILAVAVTIGLIATPAMGGSSSWLPRPAGTPAPTPTPSPSPAPEPDRENPTTAATAKQETPDIEPTPEPEPAVNNLPAAVTSQDSEETTPADAVTVPEDPGASDQQAADDATTSEVAKKDEVINPGEAAFTDYAPFDFEQIEPEPFRSKWAAFVAGVRGISRYSLFDGKVKFRLGGSLKVDGTAGNETQTYEEAYGSIGSSLDLHEGVIFANGRMREFNFSVGVDIGADPGLDHAWIEGAKGGLEVWGHYLGKLRLGFVGEPFSLERQQSSYNTAFLERSLPVTTMVPGNNSGVLIHDSGKGGRISWAAGVFSFGQSNDKNASNSLLSLTGRMTYLPVYRDDGRKLFHIGLAASNRSPTGSDIQYRTRPEARFVDYLVDTGKFSAGNITLFGLEVAAVNGPLWATAEFISSDVSAESAGDPRFTGGYLQVGWFLTGENRPYRTDSGTFGRILPLTKYNGGNPFRKRGSGAWEVAGRISYVDLNDGQIKGGEMIDYSAALSWYANPTTRVILNYVHARPKDRGSANIILMRVQFNPW